MCCRLSWAFFIACKLWLCLGFGAISADEGRASAPAVAVRVTQANGWTVAETDSFRCRTLSGEAATRLLAEQCEMLRGELLRLWGDDPAPAAWTPRCEVVLHVTQIEYNHVLGRPNDASVGSTRMNFDGERVTLRRIDLRRDAADWSTGALPHELTHVVLAERFAGRPLPRWVDEGLAMLHESAAKRTIRLTALRETLHRRAALPLRDVMNQERLPSAQDRDAFYGQSVALTSFLIERFGSKRFLAFVDAVPQTGVDAALAAHFGLDGVAALQVAWNRWTSRPATMTLIDLSTVATPRAKLVATESP